MITIRNTQGEIVELLTIEEFIKREAEELEMLFVMASHDPA